MMTISRLQQTLQQRYTHPASKSLAEMDVPRLPVSFSDQSALPANLLPSPMPMMQSHRPGSLLDICDLRFLGRWFDSPTLGVHLPYDFSHSVADVFDTRAVIRSVFACGRALAELADTPEAAGESKRAASTLTSDHPVRRILWSHAGQSLPSHAGP